MQLESCIICSSKNIKPLKGYEDTHLVKCNKCTFVFASEIPTQEVLTKHYEGYSRNDYLSPLTIKRYNELLDGFEAYRKTNKILDVGCGIGYFLEEAKRRGWEVYGTEFTDEAIKICENKGIGCEKGVLNPNNYELETFDIITSFEVIEHIQNPVKEINNFSKLLRKGGLVYVTTPNFNSLLRFKLKEKYNVITYPEHLSYYTPKTLNNLFKSLNFQKKQLLATGISLSRLKTSQGKSNQQIISATSDDENMRNSMETKWHMKMAKKIINKSLTILGVGDSLKGWYVKG